ncbi:MAG: hypothetical protein LAO04_15355 [Acidobacteriia bacterium]|nr:hypothetical protein [Terriglobia bacterium]
MTRDPWGENHAGLSCGVGVCKLRAEDSFRHGLHEGNGWPNKFELICENAECGQEQDVPFRLCTVTSLDEA